MQEKLIKSQCLKEDIKRLMLEQEIWKKEQERVAAEENRKISEFIAAQDEREHRMKQIEQQKLQIISEQQEKMCSTLNEIEVN